MSDYIAGPAPEDVGLVSKPTDPEAMLERVADKGHFAWVTSPHFRDTNGFRSAVRAALKEVLAAVDDERGYPTHELYLQAVGRAVEAMVDEVEL